MVTGEGDMISGWAPTVVWTRRGDVVLEAVVALLPVEGGESAGEGDDPDSKNFVICFCRSLLNLSPDCSKSAASEMGRTLRLIPLSCKFLGIAETGVCIHLTFSGKSSSY